MKDGTVRARAHLSGGELAQAHAAGGGLRVMFDASALVQRYAAEVGHARVLALMEQAEQVLLAAHCLSEVGAGLLRLRRDACLAPAEFDRAWQAVQRDVADMVRIPVDHHVERFAFVAMEREPLRVTDALHLGSALVANVDLFVTADRHVARLAGLLGLPSECLDDEAHTSMRQAAPTSFGNSLSNMATPQLVALTLKEAMVTR